MDSLLWLVTMVTNQALYILQDAKETFPLGL